MQKLTDAFPNKKRLDVLVTLAKFYLANKPEDSEWAILPVENFNVYYGTTCFDRKLLPEFPKSLIVREEYLGACRFKVLIE